MGCHSKSTGDFCPQQWYVLRYNVGAFFIAAVENFQFIESQEAKEVIASYPMLAQEKLLNLRRLILEAAKDAEQVQKLEETLKWGEPSYVTKKGSTIRIDWKEKNPDQYAVYFKCTSKLVPTFKLFFGDIFSYQGNRAIVFDLQQDVPEQELKQCITAALRYHNVKQFTNLGIE